ncbi:tetratricopeptide repeat protein [Pseudomonadota bacterium]
MQIGVRKQNSTFCIFGFLSTLFLILIMFAGSISTSYAVDYDKLLEQAGKLDIQENPDHVIALLDPYKDDPQNNSVTFFLVLGQAYSLVTRHREAIRLYKRGLNINPDHPELNFKVGVELLNKGDYKDALAHMKKTLKQDPNHQGAKRWSKFLQKQLNK